MSHERSSWPVAPAASTELSSACQIPRDRTDAATQLPTLALSAPRYPTARPRRSLPSVYPQFIQSLSAVADGGRQAADFAAGSVVVADLAQGLEHFPHVPELGDVNTLMRLLYAPSLFAACRCSPGFPVYPVSPSPRLPVSLFPCLPVSPSPSRRSARAPSLC
jgi:hypothetical protein